VKIEYRELVSERDFSQCIEMQRSLFNLSELDIVSPLILQLIARRNPPMGIMLGAFNESEQKQELVGYIISMATVWERSLYGAMIGVKPQYQSLGYGLNLILKLREFALKENISYLYGVFEPLEKKLAHLYINHLGFVGIQYQESVYYLQDAHEMSNPSDKLLFKWDLQAFSIHDKNRHNSGNLMSRYPLATKDDLPDSPFVFVEIPNDFGNLEKEDSASALYWRQCTREIFLHYLNLRNYIVYDCLSFEENQIKKSFYLLKSQ
jgi:predicted GNAT superfamily acetyltransferase